MIRYGALVAALLATPALAAPALSPVWTDHAVIQRDRPVVVEGTAKPGETLSGTLGGATAGTKAAKDGSFALSFPARPASNDPITLTVSGADGTSATVVDLLVGDVWLCGGQSNMEFSLWNSAGGPLAVQQSADDGLRVLMIPKVSALTPYNWVIGVSDLQASGGRPDLIVRNRANGRLYALQSTQSGLKSPVYLGGGFGGYDLAG